MTDVLVIIPAFNEQDNIVDVVEDLRTNHREVDYVVISDGSTDDTADICIRRGYNIIELPVNLGLAGAFQTGMKYAAIHDYDYAVQFDGDGQHDAGYILPMKQRSLEGYDIVIASRFVTKKKPLSMRMWGSNILSAAIFLTTRVRIKDPTSGMRMYNRKMIEEFAFRLNYAPEPDTVSFLIKQGAKVSEIQASMKERKAGKSYLTPINATKYMIRMLISIMLIQNFRRRSI